MQPWHAKYYDFILTAHIDVTSSKTPLISCFWYFMNRKMENDMKIWSCIQQLGVLS